MADRRPHRDRTPGLRVGVEPLEIRSLMAGGRNAFLRIAGALATRGERDSIPLPVRPAEFDLPTGDRVLLGLALHAGRPGRLDPGRIEVASPGGGSVDPITMKTNTARDRASLCLARVGPGDLTARVEAERRTVGSYRLDVFLAGDADANFRVDAQDLDRIRALQGWRIGQRGYLPDADVDRDGRITGGDLGLAERNLGAAWRPSPVDQPTLTVGLNPLSDPNGDFRVVRPETTLVGRTLPGATVLLDRGADGTMDQHSTADPFGQFRIDVGLVHGANPLRVSALDASGRSSTVDLTVRRDDVVLSWNQQTLDAIRADRTAPPRAARALAIVHVSVYDAVDAIVRSHAPYAVLAAPPPWASTDAAAAAAAHRALVGLFPSRAAAFDAALAATLADIPDGPAEAEGVGLGRFVAERILALRRNDGADAEATYPGGPAPGQWRPTPPNFSGSDLPHWPWVVPFALPRGDWFRPAGPPPLDSAAYAADLAEVKALGRADSTVRTPEQTLIARFWADGAGTATPPGHWNQIAQDVARQRGTTLEQNARLFALLNIALADAGLASWDAKYAAGLWRPITAIRLADTDGNPLTTADPNWTPLLVTPPFPTYTSGHSTFSGAGAEVLSWFFGPAVAFTTDTDDLPGVSRSFRSFAEAATEAGRSRIYGGIHFEFDNRDGLAAGHAVGRFVTEHLLT